MAAFGEYADDETASTCKARDYKDATDLAVTLAFPERMSGTQAASTENLAPALILRNPTAIAFSSKDYGGDVTENLSPTLRADNSNNSNPNGGQPPAIAIAGNIIGRAPENGGNQTGFSIEVGYTLTKAGRHAVATSTEPYTMAIRGRADGSTVEVRSDGTASPKWRPRWNWCGCHRLGHAGSSPHPSRMRTPARLSR